MAIYSTRELADILRVSPERIMRAVWLRHFPPPAKGPGGSYYWTSTDCDRAARHFRHRGFDEILSEHRGAAHV